MRLGQSRAGNKSSSSSSSSSRISRSSRGGSGRGGHGSYGLISFAVSRRMRACFHVGSAFVERLLRFLEALCLCELSRRLSVMCRDVGIGAKLQHALNLAYRRPVLDRVVQSCVTALHMTQRKAEQQSAQASALGCTHEVVDCLTSLSCLLILRRMRLCTCGSGVRRRKER
jgi:hypothetical protein